MSNPWNERRRKHKPVNPTLQQRLRPVQENRVISWDELTELLRQHGRSESDIRDILRSMHTQIADNEDIVSVDIDDDGVVRTTLQPKAKTSGTRS